MARKSKSQKRRAHERRAAKKNTEVVSTPEVQVENTLETVVEDVKTKTKKERNTFINYLCDVKREMVRTSWPTKIEVKNASIIVFVALIFFGLLFYLVDSAIVPVLFEYANF